MGVGGCLLPELWTSCDLSLSEHRSRTRAKGANVRAQRSELGPRVLFPVTGLLERSGPAHVARAARVAGSIALLVSSPCGAGGGWEGVLFVTRCLAFRSESTPPQPPTRLPPAASSCLSPPLAEQGEAGRGCFVTRCLALPSKSTPPQPPTHLPPACVALLVSSPCGAGGGWEVSWQSGSQGTRAAVPHRHASRAVVSGAVVTQVTRAIAQKRSCSCS